MILFHATVSGRFDLHIITENSLTSECRDVLLARPDRTEAKERAVALAHNAAHPDDFATARSQPFAKHTS